MKHSKKKMYPGGGHMRKAKANNNMPGQKMMKGGKMKKVDAKKNPGLAKLPTEVRNKMGYMAMGGMMKADEDFMYGGKMMKKMMKGGKMKDSYMMGGTMKNTMKKISEKRDEMMNRFTDKVKEARGTKPMRKKKKMMKGGKMNYPGGGMMKKGSMYPGGGRMQHD